MVRFASLNSPIVAAYGTPPASTPITGSLQGIFAYGWDLNGIVTSANKLSSAGVVSGTSQVVGTPRRWMAGSVYGLDKGIFAYGLTSAAATVSTRNLVSNTGTMAADVTGAGTARWGPGCTKYGTDTAIVIFGSTTSAGAATTGTNKISNTGVVATDVAAAAGTARWDLPGAPYGTDKGIIGYGETGASKGTVYNVCNLISNTGVVSANTTGIGTASTGRGAVTYGTDKAVFAFGVSSALTTVYNKVNLVSNTGVVASDTSTGAARYETAGAPYAYTKGAFFGGINSSGSAYLATVTTISDTGAWSADTTSAAASRGRLSGCGFSV